MALEAVIGGLGFFAFLLLYACFQINEKRYFEKMLMYFMGIFTACLIPFVLYSESLETGSDIGFLSTFMSSYFVIIIIFLVAIVFFYALFVILQQLNKLNEEKDDKE